MQHAQSHSSTKMMKLMVCDARNEIRALGGKLMRWGMRPGWVSVGHESEANQCAVGAQTIKRQRAAALHDASRQGMAPENPTGLGVRLPPAAFVSLLPRDISVARVRT